MEKKNLITISIGEEEISFDEKKVEPTPEKTTVQLVATEKSIFKFEFKGLVTDKFVVKKYDDIEQAKKVTEIWLERGLAEKLDRIPLVKLTHY